jgi:uncharacterized coiled-coil DUF342 family protein
MQRVRKLLNQNEKLRHEREELLDEIQTLKYIQEAHLKTIEARDGTIVDLVSCAKEIRRRSDTNQSLAHAAQTENACLRNVLSMFTMDKCCDWH